MFFVFGERSTRLRIERKRVQGIRRIREGDHVELLKLLGDLLCPIGRPRGRIVPRGFLQQCLKNFHRLHQRIEHRRRELKPTQPQVVEQVLAFVGELGNPILSKHRGQPLERVGGAEDPIDQVGLGIRVRGVVQGVQVAPENVDDLCCFGDEFRGALRMHSHRTLSRVPRPHRAAQQPQQSFVRKDSHVATPKFRNKLI